MLSCSLEDLLLELSSPLPPAVSYQLQMGLSVSRTPRPVSSKDIQVPNPRHTHWERSFHFHQGQKDLVSLLTVRCRGGLWQLVTLGQVTACRSKARLTFDKEPRTCSRSSVRALAISNSHYETTSCKHTFHRPGFLQKN